MALTACSETFPIFKDHRRVVCFNLRQGDAESLNLPYDPFFHWHGCYAELSKEGEPLDPIWCACLSALSSVEGVERVRSFCKERLTTNDRVFYSPGKAKRWSATMLGPDGAKQTTTENLLLRRTLDAGGVAWFLQELPKDEAIPPPLVLAESMLGRITYHMMILSKDAGAEECKPLYANDPSQAAWLDGCSLIRREADCTSMAEDLHMIEKVPESFAAVRFVELSTRDDWLRCVMDRPTFALTGATACRGSPFSSPKSTEAAFMIGKELGTRCEDHGITLMASASMRAHDETMSADHDFTKGFMEGSPECMTVHFKGSNSVMLHGDLWRMKHGVSYVVEEEDLDCSNHAKEAALVTSSVNSQSIALLGNGGPTVAINLTRFLLLCGPGRVFAFCGLHGGNGGSGAAGLFRQSEEQLKAAVKGVGSLAPSVLGALAAAAESNITHNLKERPLTLLELVDEGCSARNFVLQPNLPNTELSHGIAHGQERLMSVYARQCAQHITSAGKSQGRS